MRYSIDESVILNESRSGTKIYMYVSWLKWRIWYIFTTQSFLSALYTYTNGQLFLVNLCTIFFCPCVFFRRDLEVSVVVKLIKPNKFLMSRSWRRVKESSYGATNKISEALASMRFWVQVREFHVWSCVQCEKNYWRK